MRFRKEAGAGKIIGMGIFILLFFTCLGIAGNRMAKRHEAESLRQLNTGSCDKETHALELAGEGTFEAPYLIQSPEDLQKFSEYVNTGYVFSGEYISLEEDISLADVSFTPIGTVESGNSFSGFFDGNGHAITGLQIEGERTGFFGSLRGIAVNLMLVSGTVTGDFAGAICGVVTETGAVLNCYNGIEVTGEDTGGIAGVNRGILINNVNLLEEDTDGEKITGENQGGMIENCYTNKGNSFEIQNHTSDEADLTIRQNAVHNLNEVIGELHVMYAVPGWNLWTLSDTREPKLSAARGNPAEKFTLYLGEASLPGKYSTENHAWYFDMPQDTAAKTAETPQIAIEVTKQDGSTEFFTVENRYDVLRYDCGEIRYQIELRQSGLFTFPAELTPASDKTIAVNLENFTSESEEGVRFYQYGKVQDGKITDEWMEVLICEPGSYSLQGSMTGQVRVDFGLDGKTNGLAQADIALNGVSITNKNAPAILINNVLETGEEDTPGIRVTISDDTANYLVGAGRIQVYSEEDKNEGAFSSEVTMSVTGGTGSLTVAGELEGIESNGKLLLQGGNYYITSEDDGINASDDLVMKNGRFVIAARDDVLDSNDKIKLKNVTLMGHTPTEHLLNSDGAKLKNCFVLGSSSYENEIDEDSKQAALSLHSEELLKRGDIYVFTDNEDIPLAAIELLDEGSEIFFSTPELFLKELHIYRSDEVTGDFQEGVCQKVEAFAKTRRITHDGGEETFEIQEINNSFLMDK